MTAADRILSRIKLHSNNFSNLTQIEPLDETVTINHTFKFQNFSYQSYSIETSPEKLTHFINAILLMNFSDLACYAPQVQELIIVINKSGQIQMIIAIYMNKQADSKRIEDFTGNDALLYLGQAI